MTGKDHLNDQKNLAELQSIYGIAYGCPKMKRVSDCPLRAIEKLSFYEKVEWLNKLDSETKERILKHHSLCTKNASKTQNKP